MSARRLTFSGQPPDACAEPGRRRMPQVKVHFLRKRVRELRSQMKYGFKTFDQLVEMYGGGEKGRERAQKTKVEKMQRNQWKWHPEFPGDLDMALFWVWLEQDMSKLDSDVQELQLALSSEFDPETAQARPGQLHMPSPPGPTAHHPSPWHRLVTSHPASANVLGDSTSPIILLAP